MHIESMDSSRAHPEDSASSKDCRLNLLSQTDGPEPKCSGASAHTPQDRAHTTETLFFDDGKTKVTDVEKDIDQAMRGFGSEATGRASLSVAGGKAVLDLPANSQCDAQSKEGLAALNTEGRIMVDVNGYLPMKPGLQEAYEKMSTPQLLSNISSLIKAYKSNVFETAANPYREQVKGKAEFRDAGIELSLTTNDPAADLDSVAASYALMSLNNRHALKVEFK